MARADWWVSAGPKPPLTEWVVQAGNRQSAVTMGGGPVLAGPFRTRKLAQSWLSGNKGGSHKHKPGPPVTGTALYRNPFRDAKVTPNRVDQGVDYTGSGPIYAIGPGEIVSTKNSGWPGGGFIVTRLDNGHYWYVAEEVQPMVQVGDRVDSSTVLGYFAPAGGYIETGWAAPPPDLGRALAGVMGQFSGANATAFGSAANNVLVSLGAPSGTDPQPYRGTAPPWAWTLPGGASSTVGGGGPGGGGSGGMMGCINAMVYVVIILAWLIAWVLG